MKLFENIKDFFFAAEDEDGDFEILPWALRQENTPVWAAAWAVPARRCLPRAQAEETR